MELGVHEAVVSGVQKEDVKKLAEIMLFDVILI